MSFFQHLIQPTAIIMLFIVAVCLFGYGIPGYVSRSTVGHYWLGWLLVGVLAAIAWVILVFG